MSYQLAPNENNFKFITNIPYGEQGTTSNLSHMNLPVFFYSEDYDAYPAEWLLNENEINFLRTLHISFEDSHKIEQETVKQRLCDKWFAYNALNHGIIYEPLAREKYENVLKFELRRNVCIRETGLVIQPNLFWVGASPDGMVIDREVGIGLIEIKCPKSKVSLLPEVLLNDEKFYMTWDNENPSLRRNHEYFTQIQVAMGLSGALFCDFVVFTFGGIIISRISFDEAYFIDVMKKINMFYRTHMLPKILSLSENNKTQNNN